MLITAHEEVALVGSIQLGPREYLWGVQPTVEEGSFKDQTFFYFYQFSDDSYDEERLMITMAEKYEHKVIAEDAVIITAIMIKMIIIAILPMKRGSGVEVQSSGSSLAAI